MVTPYVADRAAPLFVLNAAHDCDAPTSSANTASGLGALRQTMRRVLRASQARLLSLWGADGNVNDLDALEDALLAADVGPSVAHALRTAAAQEPNIQERQTTVLNALTAMLQHGQKPLSIDLTASPYVMLFVGVNGTGKTTTIAKYAARLQAAGVNPLMVAGDTFRAAAVQQLSAWGERTGVEVMSGAEGCDAAGLLFDACARAQAEGHGVVLADTAGRLHNKRALTDELRKMIRVLRKFNPNAPHEVLLVLDATTGQNALTQAEVFREMADVTGFVITKLDGSAKGGIAPALVQKMRLPIYAIATGEGLDDLYPFSADAYARALLVE